METLLKKIKYERLKKIIFGFLSFLFIYASLCVLFLAPILKINSNPDNRIIIPDVNIDRYDDYEVVKYSVDGVDYQKIRTISKKEKNTPIENLIFSYRKDFPTKIYVEIKDDSSQDLSSTIFVLGIVCTIAFVLIALFYIIIYNKYLRILKNGIVIETEIVKHVNESYIVKWINAENNKAYYYIFNTKSKKQKWEEINNKIYLVVNKTNYKEFFVAGKEIISI